MERIKGKLYHLSHIDLDGYGCQLLTTNLVKKVICFNSDYGKGILENINEIFKLIDIDLSNNIVPSILITDLNLTEEDAFYINSEVEKRNINITLLDHHESGKNVSEKYDWYYLDISKCATLLTYEFLKNAMYNIPTQYLHFSKIVNVYDLWKENEIDFNKGKLLSFIVFNSGYKFPKELKDEKRNLILFLLKNINDLYLEDFNIKQIERYEIPELKELYLRNKIEKELYDNNNIILEDKYNKYVYTLMKELNFPIFSLDNIKIKLFYNIDGGVFQNIASFFNSEKEKEFDCCLNVLNTGKVSLRSKGSEPNKNVNILANKYFNGGGHFNASGGKISIKEKKELSFEDVLEYLKSI